jgi:hypothetical protein
MKTPTKRLLKVWFACCAILLNALVPSVSHALAHGGNRAHGWEICLNDGTRLSGAGELDRATFLALTDRSRAPSARLLARVAGQPEVAVKADCGHCLAHAGVTGLPPSTALSVPAAPAHAARPFLFYHAPRPLAAWSAAQPRGPPLDA